MENAKLGQGVRMNTYKGWESIPAHLGTKTRLKEQDGLRPEKETKPVALVKALTPRGYKEFDLFDKADCVEIKKRKVDVSFLDYSDKCLSDALYMVNKSAKKSRDTKTKSYSSGKHAVVSRSKTRQERLYDLKDKALKKLEKTGRLTLRGYHKQSDNYLHLYEFGRHTFHKPVRYVDKSAAYLGEIEGIIGSERSKETQLNYFQAVKLLENYVTTQGIGREFQRS
ncbi:hypothetical protein [Halobacillus seohaensis]|uniref:Uncharacterized protein n=1 Tax=Halobacillus seohaensis TaxID=447421 RepID=A0ABW2EKF0_9BACI